MRSRTIEQLLDTGVANEYMQAYLDIALKRAGINEYLKKDVRDGLLYALDMYTAGEAWEGWNKGEF